MKTRNQTRKLETVMALAIITIAFAFIACQPEVEYRDREVEKIVEVEVEVEVEVPTYDESKAPKANRTFELKNLFANETCNATILMDNVSEIEFLRTRETVRSAIEGTYANDASIRGTFRTAFADARNVEIIVQETAEYATCRVVANNRSTLYVNINGLANLESVLPTAITAMVDSTNYPDGYAD